MRCYTTKYFSPVSDLFVSNVDMQTLAMFRPLVLVQRFVDVDESAKQGDQVRFLDEHVVTAVCLQLQRALLREKTFRKFEGSLLNQKI